MRLVDSSRSVGVVTERAALRCSCVGGGSGQLRDVQVEHSLDVCVNAARIMRIVCTPDHLPELVLGRLLTEGTIERADDVVEIRMSDDASKAYVRLGADRRTRNPESRLVPTYGGADRVFSVVEGAGKELEPVSPLPWDPAWVYSLAERFGADAPMHRKTHGAHSCYLAVRDRLAYCCEDLGRHNALDKAIGCALRDGVPLGEAIVYTSGRVPVDMLAKAIRAGVPLVVSNAMPTNRAVDMARDYGVTLICRARPDSMLVFSDPARVVDGASQRDWEDGPARRAFAVS